MSKPVFLATVSSVGLKVGAQVPLRWNDVVVGKAVVSRVVSTEKVELECHIDREEYWERIFKEVGGRMK